MPVYFYKAQDASGRPVTGTMEGAGKDEVTEKLRRMGYAAAEITEKSLATKGRPLFSGFRKVKSSEVIMLISKLSNLINAGVTILGSLNTLVKQTKNDQLKDAVSKVVYDIEKGDNLSQALSKHPAVFSKLSINMIKAGEASGKLDEALKKLAQFLEWQGDLEQKIKGAIIYPIILLIGGVAVTVFLVTFVIPQFAEMFVSLGLRLPLPTVILYEIGVGIKRFWHVGIFLFFIGIAAVRGISRTENGKVFFDNLKLKMPLTGPLYRQIVMSRFTRTLASLAESGVPVLESLSLTKDVVGNEILGRVIAKVYTSVEKGQPIAENLEKYKEFPEDMVKMIAIGEETGNLVDMLNKISDFYDKYIDYATKSFASMIEPLFICVLGGMVGYIMVSMLIPIFEIIKAIK